MNKNKTIWTNLTDEEKQIIDNMSHIEMARLWRFAESGHKYFVINSEISNYFLEVFNNHGGMTPEISKQIGW